MIMTKSIQLGDVIEGWGTIHHLFQDHKEVKDGYTYRESKHLTTFISKAEGPRGRLTGYDIAELRSPFANGTQLIVERAYGDNADYTAVNLKTMRVIAEYHVDNYGRGRQGVGDGNWGEFLGKPLSYTGRGSDSLSAWLKLVKGYKS